jgi:cytochrome d ubiquinol oxidase subunit I
LRMALPVGVVAVFTTMFFGDIQGRLMERQQPMKMAAAEVIYHTTKGAGLSLFATGSFSRAPGHLSHNIQVPHVLSLIADFSWNGTQKGMVEINRAEQAKYGPGSYIPILGVTYWAWRAMIGAGTLMLLLGAWGLLLIRRGRIDRSRLFPRLALLGVVLPILANWSGWVFTEMGRQPWVVYGLLKTSDARSPRVATGDVAFTLSGYIVVYAILILIGGWLMLREMRHGPEPAPGDGEAGPPDALALAY